MAEDFNFIYKLSIISSIFYMIELPNSARKNKLSLRLLLKLLLLYP